jgi:tetratricopeptide (TPR) repeat protein
MRPNIQPSTGMSGLFPSAGVVHPPSGGSKTINMLGIPGLQPGIPGAGVAKKDKGILARFRRQSKLRQYIIIAFVIAATWTLLWDDDEFSVDQPRKGKSTQTGKKDATPPKPGASATPVDQANPSFESLSPEKQRFVEAQHNLAFDYYRNREYGKALYEIQKIFELIPDYKDSREIERYSKEGKRKQDAQEEERRKKEEEARTKARIAELVDQAAANMKKRQYEQAREVFPKILSLDPDNTQVSNWKKEIDDWDEKQRLAEQEKEIQKEINDKAWGTYKHGLALKRQRRYHTAIVIFGKLAEDGTSDRRLAALSRRMIQVCRALITARRKPYFAAGEQAEKAGEFTKAMRNYARALAIDPSYSPSAVGLERVKKILHERAKNVYTEAVLAESYSDFDTAKAKYKEILATAPADDIYFERAQRKMGRYFTRGVAQQEQQ